MGAILSKKYSKCPCDEDGDLRTYEDTCIWHDGMDGVVMQYYAENNNRQ